MDIFFKMICYPGEGRNRVLGHWACYKVETSTADEADTARQVHYVAFYVIGHPKGLNVYIAGSNRIIAG